jgi:hypothetical protein
MARTHRSSSGSSGGGRERSFRRSSSPDRLPDGRGASKGGGCGSLLLLMLLGLIALVVWSFGGFERLKLG